ncbi:hypothetical protein EJ04DRAFT_579104 [Polyplosphaeria fusca]|uniref:Uncharacterized protein n=1 Tax=Polyplosphaeria fusca TaxID=682080 RepID=A0A9P4UYK3_9PLEO|nr:hypothetical protein EJ04DRAFT_579104 [Polyplosphaeria fusca]
MPSVDRDSSLDRELAKQQHSFEFGRPIPMWDSSDPDRAPPPLPLNPGSPSLTTRPNTSAAIVNAARALEEKARESMPASSYTTNPMPSRSPDRSPERSLIKGAQHKRMQSLQTTSVRDLRSFLDGVRSPERSPERPSTRGGTPAREVDKDPFAMETSSRTGTPTPSSRDLLKDTPALRPSSRPLQKAILGENTPPSATMLALQTMTIPREHLDPPLSNVTNGSSKPSQPPQSFDAISDQLIGITNIVSSLQKEMSQLSRRSKDNAGDLISLKEATGKRDEDIRNSLKTLVSTMGQVPSFGVTPGEFSHSGSANGTREPVMTPTKQFNPRVPSPQGFFMDERIGSPNPYSVEGAASVAMLEKIIREMVTRDGQERLITNLQKLVDKATGETAKKVTELVEFVKQGSASNALVPTAPLQPASFQPSTGYGPLARTVSDVNGATFSLPKVGDGAKPYSSPKAADFVSDEMLSYLRKIKDSVAQSGGVSMEAKLMVKDLRGEVLGMGRELARKIEEAELAKATQPAIDSGQSNEEINAIVQEGLANLKDQMDQVLRQRRRQSMSSTMTRNTVDSQEVYDVVKRELAERGLERYSSQGGLLDKEAVLSAVKEAYEAYRPEIHVEQIGLTQDEILQCLREGLQEYSGSNAVNREDVLSIVQDAMQHVRLPQPIDESHEIREEVLVAVRECLEEFKPAFASRQPEFDGMLREQILDVIREGLQGLSIDIPPEAVTTALKVAYDESSSRDAPNRSADMHNLQGLLDEMHTEFKAYSSANGRDTEQVLDAVRDGLERLRTEIESYVDRAQDVTQKDEIVDTMRSELERLRADVQGYVAQGLNGDDAWTRADMVDFIKAEFEHLHEQITSRGSPDSTGNADIFAALQAGFDGMKSQVATRNLDLDSNEDINEAMKQEFDQLKDVILGDTGHHKDEVLEKLQAGFDALHARLGEHTAPALPSDDLLGAIKEEFEHLRESLGNSLVHPGSSADKEDIIDAVRELVEGIRSQLTSSQENGLTTVQAELEELKTSIGSTLVRTGESIGQEELLNAIKTGLEDIKTSSKSMGINEELLEAFRGELEQIRQSNSLTRNHSRADAEEILEAVRLGLDDLRSHLEKKLDRPDQQISASSEIVDSLNDGLEGLRSDISKMTDKPVDMTVSYEILDTLKEGFVSLHEDIQKLKGVIPERELDAVIAPTGNEVVLAEDPDAPAAREVVSESLRRNDLEKMEVMLAQLQIKVEAMDANIQTPTHSADSTSTTGSLIKDDLAGIEGLLKDLQVSVLGLQEKENIASVPEGLATKDDTDAIETLLANIKAKMDELVLPDPTTTVTKENIDDVELVVRTTSEAVESLAKKLEEDGATKGDVAVVQIIVDDIKTALEEMKSAKPAEGDEVVEKATKADVDSLALLVCDIKAKLDEMKIPSDDELPSKSDVEQLTGLIHDFRDSHNKFLESYEGDIGITAKCFDDRKQEAAGMVESMADVKAALDEIKDEIKTNLTEGGAIDSLKESFKSLEDTIGSNFSITADVKELMETVSREFERAHGSIEGLRNDQEEKSALGLEKHDETKDAIIAGLVEKIDDRFNTLMTKYDDAQLLADEQAKVMKEKAEEQEKILENTKAMADDLKLTIDTLGATITGMNDRFEDATQKWTSDSATVFGKIDDTIAKLDEQQLEGKTEHQHTRDEIANIERVFNGLQDNITEYHPKFMVTLREIQALVAQHYEHSQKARENAEEQSRAMAEETKQRAEELRSHFSSLPALLPAPAPAIESTPTYDDTQLQEKIDKLLGHVDETDKSTPQLERLDQIHAQVKATAAEVTEFVAKQTQFITDGNEAKEKEADELALLIERRIVQKEHLEADIEGLKAEKEKMLQEVKDEKARVLAELKEEKERTIMELKEDKDQILAMVAALQVERENLADQKIRLSGEASSLRTLLDIRREELHAMDAKADALERRILNGIMDHSRALLLAKGGQGSPKKLKKRMTADLAGDESKLMPPPSTAASGLSMALKPRSALRRNGPPPDPASRRILSLSQISGNTPTGAQAYPNASIMAANSSLKRSQSVKNSYPRKTSWNGRPKAIEGNKENETLSEESETETETTPKARESLDTFSIAEDHSDVQSETGTERRHSIGNASNAESYAEGETPGSDARSIYSGTGSEYTYGSGSYMTGSDLDRRTSYGSTARSTHLDASTLDEGSEVSASDDDDEHTATLDFGSVAPSEVYAPPNTEMTTGSEVSAAPTEDQERDDVVAPLQIEGKPQLHVYTHPSDSGVGSDIPTAVLEAANGENGDYFRRQAEEEEESTVG